MKNKNYKAVLFHPSGDWVTDFYGSHTIEEVWESINDMGSKWIFHPICFVTSGSPLMTVHLEQIVDTPTGLEFMKGWTIGQVKAFLKSKWDADSDSICEMINDNYPMSFIYDN